MHHRVPPSKTWWPSLNVAIIPPVMRSSWTTQNSDHPADCWSNSWANLGRPPNFGYINSWVTGNLTWAGWVHHSWRFGHSEALREVGPEMPERGSKTSTVPVVWANLEFFSARSKWFPVGRDWWPWTKPGYITMTWRQSNNQLSGGIVAHPTP